MSTIIHTYTTGPNSLVIEMSDGSAFHIIAGARRLTASYAPDNMHYPEPCGEDGKVPAGPFTKF